MINKENTIKESLFKLQIYKLITEYQIRWLSTSYEIPGLSYQIIAQQFPNIPTDVAVKLLNEWLRFETTRNISVYDKARFNADSNVETILKLQMLLKEINENIYNLVNQTKETEIPQKEKGKSFTVAKTENEVTITFHIPSRIWFKRDNVISLSIEEANKLQKELKKVLAKTRVG